MLKQPRDRADMSCEVSRSTSADQTQHAATSTNRPLPNDGLGRHSHANGQEKDEENQMRNPAATEPAPGRNRPDAAISMAQSGLTKDMASALNPEERLAYLNHRRERGMANNEREARVRIQCAADIMAARQRGRAVASQGGFSNSDLTIIATAIYEVARNIVEHANGGEITIALINDA